MSFLERIARAFLLIVGLFMILDPPSDCSLCCAIIYPLYSFLAAWAFLEIPRVRRVLLLGFTMFWMQAAWSQGIVYPFSETLRPDYPYDPSYTIVTAMPIVLACVIVLATAVRRRPISRRDLTVLAVFATGLGLHFFVYYDEPTGVVFRMKRLLPLMTTYWLPGLVLGTLVYAGVGRIRRAMQPNWLFVSHAEEGTVHPAPPSAVRRVFSGMADIGGVMIGNPARDDGRDVFPYIGTLDVRRVPVLRARVERGRLPMLYFYSVPAEVWDTKDSDTLVNQVLPEVREWLLGRLGEAESASDDVVALVVVWAQGAFTTHETPLGEAQPSS